MKQSRSLLHIRRSIRYHLDTGFSFINVVAFLKYTQPAWLKPNSFLNNEHYFKKNERQSSHLTNSPNSRKNCLVRGATILWYFSEKEVDFVIIWIIGVRDGKSCNEFCSWNFPKRKDLKIVMKSFHTKILLQYLHLCCIFHWNKKYPYIDTWWQVCH